MNYAARLTDACSPARVCTTKEFMLSTDTDDPVANAWILPEIVGAFDGPLGPTIVDF